MLDSFAFCLDSGREFLASNKIFPMHPKEIIELKSSDCNGLIRKLKREDSWDTKENILVILHSDPRTNLLIAFSWRKFTGYLKLTLLKFTMNPWYEHIFWPKAFKRGDSHHIWHFSTYIIQRDCYQQVLLIIVR